MSHTCIRPAEDGQEAYETLARHLHPPLPLTSTNPLDVDILPSALASTLQFCPADNALAIPKSLLLSCFPIARAILLHPPSSRGPRSHEDPQAEWEAAGLDMGLCYPPGSPGAEDEHLSKRKMARSPLRNAKYLPEREDGQFEAQLAASAVILLHDPNHLSALNVRKEFMLRHNFRYSHSPETLTPLVARELRFLSTLLRSPLPRHNKCSALFGYRLHLLRLFELTKTVSTPAKSPFMGRRGGNQTLHPSSTSGRGVIVTWAEELDLVMQAGDKHLGNYYAWEYARAVWDLVFRNCSCRQGGEEEQQQAGGCARGGETLDGVLEWCFRHPRDVSGWCFLAWMLERGQGACMGCGIEKVDLLRERVVDWRERLAWKGPALDQFVERADRLLSGGKYADGKTAASESGITVSKE